MHSVYIADLQKVQNELSETVMMLARGEKFIDVARRLHAIEKTIFQTKRDLVGEHSDQKLDAIS